MVRHEQLEAKDLIKQPITLEPSQTLYDVRSILIRYNISRVVISKDALEITKQYLHVLSLSAAFRNPWE
ncbi:MAG: hypothetical protein M3044_15465 [Thermoproteota archaeon]|nr:hypothetical protein [Thermoproteota archaeon]